MAKLLRKFGGRKAPPAPPKRDYNKGSGIPFDGFDDGESYDRDIGVSGSPSSPGFIGIPWEGGSPRGGRGSPTDTLSSFQTCVSDTFPKNHEKGAVGGVSTKKGRDGKEKSFLDDYSEPVDAKSSEFQRSLLSAMGDDSYTEPYDAKKAAEACKALEEDEDDRQLYDDPLDCDLDDVGGFEEFSEFPADDRPKDDYEDPWEFSFKNSFVTQIKDMAQSESMHFEKNPETNRPAKDSQMDLDFGEFMDNALRDSSRRDHNDIENDDDPLNLSAGNYEEPWDLRAKKEELESKFRAANKRTSTTEEQILHGDNDVGGLVGEIMGCFDDGDKFKMNDPNFPDTEKPTKNDHKESNSSRIAIGTNVEPSSHAGAAGGPRFLRQEDFLPKGLREEKVHDDLIALPQKEPVTKDKPPMKPKDKRDKDGKKRPQPKPRRKAEVPLDRVRHPAKHEHTDSKDIHHKVSEKQIDAVSAKDDHHVKPSKEQSDLKHHFESKSAGNTHIKTKKRDDTLEKKLREKYNLADGDSSSESYGYGPFNGYRGGVTGGQNHEASRSDSWTFLCFDPETEFKKFKTSDNGAGGPVPPPVPTQPPPSNAQLVPKTLAQPPSLPPTVPSQPAVPPEKPLQSFSQPVSDAHREPERSQLHSVDSIPSDLPPPVPTQPIPAARIIPGDPPPVPNTERPIASSRNIESSSDRPPELPRSNPPKRGQPPKEEYDDPWDKKNVFKQLASGHKSEPLQQPPPPPKPRNLEKGCKSVGERVDPNLPLQKQDWYHGQISRIDAEHLLRVHKEGSYLVRNSESSKDDYSLSLKSARGFMHMKIVCRDGSYILGQFSQPYKSISEMIHHYSIHKLPIKGAEHMSLLHPVVHETL